MSLRSPALAGLYLKDVPALAMVSVQREGRCRIRLYPRPAYHERACDLPTRSRLPAG